VVVFIIIAFLEDILMAHVLITFDTVKGPNPV
jgi:hypothetical protein